MPLNHNMTDAERVQVQWHKTSLAPKLKQIKGETDQVKPNIKLKKQNTFTLYVKS